MFYNILIIIILFCIIFYEKRINLGNFSEHNLNNKKYLKHFNEMDFKLRKCPKNKCLNKYNNFIIPFTKNEIKYINKLTLNLNKIFDKLFYKNNFKFHFLKSKNNMENSLPHTRNNFVIFSQDWYDRLQDKNIFYNETYFKLMFHEIFHIFQRNNLNLLSILYKDFWNLTKLNKELPKNIKSISRTNPDALPNNNWLFKVDENKYILPMCIYTKYSANITNTENVYYILDKNLNFLDDTKFYNLNNLNEYSEYFGVYNSNNYHPNELSSSIFEDIIYNKYYSNKNINNFSLGYINMVGFLEKYCDLKN